MKTVTFSGHSDDTVTVEDASGADEHACYQSSDEKILHASFVVGGRVRVRAFYDGVWSFAAAHVSENIAWPDWPVRVVKEHEYSTRLEIDTPDECASVVRERDQ